MPRTPIAYRPCIERMMLVRRKLVAGERFTAVSIAREMEVSRKTIDRDIQFMRDRLNYAIQFDQTINSWTGQPPVDPVL